MDERKREPRPLTSLPDICTNSRDRRHLPSHSCLRPLRRPVLHRLVAHTVYPAALHSCLALIALYLDTQGFGPVPQMGSRPRSDMKCMRMPRRQTARGVAKALGSGCYRSGPRRAARRLFSTMTDGCTAFHSSSSSKTTRAALSRTCTVRLCANTV
ncbi:hypothetical protein BD309DRAFT_412569 [Dichomitus squalens]|nr:hypothetical protein BD309DRAFT_412569 [Dichomitus squalens]